MGFDPGLIKELENPGGQEGRGHAREQNRGKRTEECSQPEGGREEEEATDDSWGGGGRLWNPTSSHPYWGTTFSGTREGKNIHSHSGDTIFLKVFCFTRP